MSNKLNNLIKLNEVFITLLRDKNSRSVIKLRIPKNLVQAKSKLNDKGKTIDAPKEDKKLFDHLMTTYMKNKQTETNTLENQVPTPNKF